MLRYVLLIGAPHSGKLTLVKKLLGPDSTEFSNIKIKDESHGGLIVPHTVDTSYFSVDIKILVDEFPDSRLTSTIVPVALLRDWVREFTSSECADLHDVLEDAIMPVKELLCNEGNERFFAVAATLPSDGAISDAEIEDIVISHGIEYIDMRKPGFNEFKEKIGPDRIRELLETHLWPNKVLKHDYQKSKLKKAQDMSTPLLGDTGEMELDQIFQKLKVAKAHVDSMSATEKEKYVQDLIEEVIDFI